MNIKIKSRECSLLFKMKVVPESTSLWSLEYVHLHLHLVDELTILWQETTYQMTCTNYTITVTYEEANECKWLNLTGARLINSVCVLCSVSGLYFEVVWVISMSHLVMPKRQDLIARCIHYVINWIHPWLMKHVHFDSWKQK